MKLAWLTDLHLNFLRPKARDAFIQSVRDTQPDAVLLGGDVDEAAEVATTLETLARAWGVPVYFVLGNHDFYHGSIAALRAQVRELTRRVSNLVYLDGAGVVALTPRTTLVGVDGWGDGGYGNAATSSVRLNDAVLIRELAIAGGSAERLEVVRRLGEEAGEHLRASLADVRTAEVIVLTHVPPFREAAWHEGKPSGDDWLPFFACRSTGDALLDESHSHPEREMLVLCGHTHGAGECQVLPNLRVLTGGAEYGRPAVERMIEVN